MKNSLIKILCVFTICVGMYSCEKFIDIVPDNVATIDNAFTLRSTARRYLFTCYSYLPNPGSIISSPSFLRGEIWPLYVYGGVSADFVRNRQNVVDPLLNFWEGRQSAGTDLFEGIRDCNIFLENIYSVPDMDPIEQEQWAAEVKFLKAYYMFYLVRCYGPIPIIRKNLPIDAGIESVRVRREPVDSCFNYIVGLLDEAIPQLPNLPLANNNLSDVGRITRPIAMSVKALVLVTAASPLFNGNTDYANYTDEKYGPLFNQEYSQEKWKKAMIAAKEAIEDCEKTGHRLYEFQQGPVEDLSDTTIIKMSIRNAVTEENINLNHEVIWYFTGSNASQSVLTPRTWDPENNINDLQGRYGPSINVVNLFYTNHGLPIDEDKEWDYDGRFNIDTAKAENRYNIAEGYETVAMHFNRGSRFYASTGFDGGIWYGQGKYDDNDSWHLEGRAGGYTSAQLYNRYTPTGYWPKKLIDYQNVVEPDNYRVYGYNFPLMRLAGLYLLYAEAANEYQGPGEEIYKYLNKIRTRAGLPTVQNSWANYSRHPDKYTTKEGLREIIRRERQIELLYESKRYWDLLRWKTAEQVLSEPILGWSLRQEDPEQYYKPQALFQSDFRKRDYFWPVREYVLIRNENLLQSPGW